MGKSVCINKHVSFISSNILEREQHIEFMLWKKLDKIVSLSFIVAFIYRHLCLPVCWNSDGRGTALQDGGSRVQLPLGSLGVFTDISFRLLYGLGIDLACNTSEYQGYLLGVKAAVA
jgi:hypothetical protein